MVEQSPIEGVAIFGDAWQERRQRHARVVRFRPRAANAGAHEHGAAQHGRSLGEEFFRITGTGAFHAIE